MKSVGGIPFGKPPAANLAGSQGLWHYIWKLLRLRLVILFSGWKRSKTRRKIVWIVVAIVVLGLAALLFWLSLLLLGFLRSPLMASLADPGALLNSVPAMVVSVAFVLNLLTNFGVLLQSLYLARDMDFLLTAPLPMRAVFFAKLLQAILPNFGLMCFFALPVMFGLGSSAHYSILYYPAVLVALALLTLAASGISALLVMAVVRVVPARRVAEVLGFVGAIISMLLSQSGRIIGETHISSEQASTVLNRFTALNAPWSPLAWTGQGLIALGEGRWLPALGLLVASLGLAGGLFWVCLSSAEWLYYTGWASMQGSPRKKKKKVVRREGVRSEIGSEVGRMTAAITLSPSMGLGTLPLTKEVRPGRRLPAALTGLLVKDFRLMRRDLRNLSNLITPLILGVLYTLSMSGSFNSRSDSGSGFGSFVAGGGFQYFSVAFALFIGWGLVLNLSLGGFSREGRQFWLIRTSPVNQDLLLLAKYLAAFLPGVAFEIILVAIMAVIQRFSLDGLAYSLAAVILSVAGVVGINLFFGVTGARLDWEDPRHMTRNRSGCLSTLVSFLYLGLVIMLFLLPPVGAMLLGLPLLLGRAVGLVLGAAASLAAAIIPPVLVRAKVSRIGVS